MIQTVKKLFFLSKHYFVKPKRKHKNILRKRNCLKCGEHFLKKE